MTFEVTGLADASESQATFTVPLEFVPQPTAQPTAPEAASRPCPATPTRPGYYGYGYYPYSSPTAVLSPGECLPRL